MKLHENKELFREAVIATSQLKKLPEIYIEKDYWVTLALHTIFTDEIGKETVFKGGTALSKCFGLIHRFSEDIDLVVLRQTGETGNRLKAKLKAISNCVLAILPEIEIEGITNKLGMIRKTAHSYERHFEGNFGQVRNNIIIESTWLGNFEPNTKGEISSFIYEMISKNNQIDIIEEYDLKPFEVSVLSPQSTLCEKIMSLVRFSQTNEPIRDLGNKIRHTYDIHFLLKNNSLHSFFHSPDFDTLLLQVGKDDIRSFRNNNEWVFNHPSNATIFAKTEDTWTKIKSIYAARFNELVYGELPDEMEILNTLIVVSDRLKRVKWNLKPRAKFK